MSITLTNDNINYKELLREFSLYYYNIFDSNYFLLNNLYFNNTLFTYNGCEFYGFNALINFFSNNDVYFFKHRKLHITGQPLNSTDMLINVYGTISYNNNNIDEYFTECITLKKINGSYFITNNIFQTIR